MHRKTFCLCFGLAFAVSFFTILLTPLTSRAQSTGNQSAQSEPVPVVDGGLGQCSVEFTTIGPDNKPVKAATIRVRIAYGFLGAHRLDLEVGTNSDGKARFEGLPSNLKNALLFRASKETLRGAAAVDPAKECTAKHTLVMEKSRDTEGDTQ